MKMYLSLEDPSDYYQCLILSDLKPCPGAVQLPKRATKMTRISTETVRLHRSSNLFDNLNVSNYRSSIRAAVFPPSQSFRNTLAWP
jgi:hypothetical protein